MGNKLEIDDLKKKLFEQQPFIYEINKQYYIIGNSESIYLYESSIIGRYQDFLKENENRKSLFIAILKYCIEYTNEYHKKSDKDLLIRKKEHELFLNTLEDNEKKYLLEQANDFRTTHHEFYSDIKYELEEYYD